MDPSPRLPTTGADALYAPPLAPLTEADAGPARPGWAKAMGICHILVATLSTVVLLISIFWVLMIALSSVAGGDNSALMGLDEPRYIWFVMVDGVSGLIANGFTFASGVALVNLRAWGARMWNWLAPAKIGRLVLVWGGFIVGVGPPLAANMGQILAKLMAQQSTGPKGMTTVEQLTLIYAWMFLAMGIGMIVLGSIYPAATWWLVRRRGIQAALVETGADSGAGSIVAGPVGEAHPS